MGAELTLTTSVFPSDEVTREYFALLGRAARLAAARRRPRRRVRRADRARPERARAAGRAARLARPRGAGQRGRGHARSSRSMVGSCTNSSWEDMWAVRRTWCAASRWRPSMSFVVFPGSHRILEMMAREGLLADLLAAGATVSEPTCGSCAGIGHVPAAGTQEPARLQPQLPGAERREGRLDLSLLAGDGRGLRAHRRHHRSAHAGRRARCDATRRRSRRRWPGCRRRADGRGRASGAARARTSSRCRVGEPVAEDAGARRC